MCFVMEGFVLRCGIVFFAVGMIPVDGRNDLAVPINVTVSSVTSSSAWVSWFEDQTAGNSPGRYDVVYKPTDARYKVIIPVRPPTRTVPLENLLPGSSYQVLVVSVSQSGNRNNRVRSAPTWFWTLPSADNANSAVLPYYPSAPEGRNVPASGGTPGSLVVRPEEVGIIILVLAVWVGAVALFFNRWGKIRMLLPYQPVFKEEEVPPKPPTNLTGAQGGGTLLGTPSMTHRCQVSPCRLERGRSLDIEVGYMGSGACRLGSNLPNGHQNSSSLNVRDKSRILTTLSSLSRSPRGGSSLLGPIREPSTKFGHYPLCRKARSAEVITLRVTDHTDSLETQTSPDGIDCVTTTTETEAL